MMTDTLASDGSALTLSTSEPKQSPISP